MLEQLPNIALCMTICFATWGIFYNVLYRRWGIDYTRQFWWTTAYFIGSAAVTSIIFWEHISRVLQNFTALPLMVLGIFMLFQLVLYVYIPKWLHEPKDYFEKYPDRYYLKIDWRRLISKSADIGAQQILIVLLVLFLQDAGLPLYQLVLWFFVLFVLLHVPLIASEWGRWPSGLFAGAVVAFSASFPLLILYVPYGFVYTFILHWLFYTLTGLVFWSIRSIDVKV